jgi:hypothetical protein
LISCRRLEVNGSAEPGTRRLAQVAGWLLLITLGGIFLRHVGTQVIAGQDQSGTKDLAAIAAYYAHGGLSGIYWVTAATLLAFVGFLVTVRSLVAARGDAAARVMADAGAAFGLIEVALLFVELGLSAALVALAASPAVESASAMLGVFAAWDWIFNGMVDWLEFGAVALISIAAGRSGLIPRRLVGLGLVAAVLRPVSALVLLLGLPFELKFAVTLPFIAWFVAFGITLIRTADREGAVHPGLAEA